MCFLRFDVLFNLEVPATFAVKMRRLQGLYVPYRYYDGVAATVNKTYHSCCEEQLCACFSWLFCGMDSVCGGVCV